MVDGAALLMAPLFGAAGSGFWSDERGNEPARLGRTVLRLLRCADGLFVSVGAIEAKFFAELLDGLGLDPPRSARPRRVALARGQRTDAATAFASRSRDDWAEVFADRDACVAPVLTMAEAPTHPHLAAWGTFIELDGVAQPSPAPRFDRTPAPHPSPPRAAGADTDEVLAEWGIADSELARLHDIGAIA